MLSRAKIIVFFCIANVFCKEFDSNMKEMTPKADGMRDNLSAFLSRTQVSNNLSRMRSKVHLRFLMGIEGATPLTYMIPVHR